MAFTPKVHMARSGGALACNTPLAFVATHVLSEVTCGNCLKIDKRAAALRQPERRALG